MSTAGLIVPNPSDVKDIPVVFPADRAREQLSALASELLQRRDTILGAWHAAAETAPERNMDSSLSRAKLNDHISVLLDCLSLTIRASPEQLDPLTQQIEIEKVCKHGLQQGSPLRGLIREWGYLQMSVADELERYAATHPSLEPGVMPTARRAWAQLCADVVTESATQHARLQQSESAGHVNDSEQARLPAEARPTAAHDLVDSAIPPALRSAEDLEIDAFERLKPQLARLWDTVFPGDKDAYTSVIVPSLSLDREEMAKIAGITFYEERLLFLLMRLRNPRARLIYITSQPVHPMVLDYYLQLLVGIPASHARARLTLLCAYDSSPRSLTEKILERPRLIDRIAAAIGDPSQAYLTVFNATAAERSLAVRLGVPMNATDPRLTSWGSKSGSRRLFRELDVDLPYGHEDLHDVDGIEAALLDIAERRPGIKHAVLKLNESFSGEGNARFTFPPTRTRPAIREALEHLLFSIKTETTAAYLAKFVRGGGIVEEMIEAAEVTSPSVQLRINPRRDVILSSTHEQILGGPSGQVYLGCLFPAADDYRSTLQDLGIRIGRGLAEKGVIGRFSVDFLASRDRAGEPWHVAALEVNLRMGGTTHPMLALRFLTGGELDRSSGLLYAADGRAKYYRASDNVESDQYRGLLPDDLIDILATHQLDFSHRTSTGVLFHMIGAVSQFGKVGLVAIGNSREEADRLFDRTVSVLDEETVGRSHV